MYQIAIKQDDHYYLPNPSVVLLSLDTAKKQASEKIISGTGEWVILQYAPFKVLDKEGNSLEPEKTKEGKPKEKV